MNLSFTETDFFVLKPVTPALPVRARHLADGFLIREPGMRWLNAVTALFAEALRWVRRFPAPRRPDREQPARTSGLGRIDRH